MRPARNPSRLSPSGVLIDIPVMTTRSGSDKIDLHDPERADDAIPHELPCADSGIVVPVDDFSQDEQLVARADGSQIQCVVNLEGANGSVSYTHLRAHETGR